MLTQQSATTALLTRYQAVRGATLHFCEPLTPEDMMVQSCPEASPVKWHLAHTSWFFETFVLSEFIAAYQPFHPEFRWLFNSYYKALGEMPEKKLRASFSRPPLERILAYRRHVDIAVERLLDQNAPDEAQRRIVLGLEHECQHLELAVTDIKHAFFTNPLRPVYAPPLPMTQSEEALARMAPPLEWLTFTPPAPGVVEVGISPDPAAIDSFAFDNETPRHPVYLSPFQLASRLTTCAEYLAFMDEDGYNRPELWLSEGWDEVQANGWQAPLYWTRDPEVRSGWSVFTLRGQQPLEELSETPVCHLSFFEADAFARWSGHRLPTEFEWESAAAGLRFAEVSSPDRAPGGNLLDSEALHPEPATLDGTSRQPQQMFGDVWEWTSSPYVGYPGYRPLPGALGEYNGKFMSSQMVLRGGSCATPASHIRPTYRNFFKPGVRWQFSGLRLARDAS